MYDKRHSVSWGLLLICLGVSFFLSMQGFGAWWQYFIIGLGGILLIEARRHGTGSIIAGVILIGVGVAFLTGIGNWWPLILIVVGVAILLNSWLRR